jgi:hypothetical protein
MIVRIREASKKPSAIPQGQKPALIFATSGTAEAVPFQNIDP